MMFDFNLFFGLIPVGFMQGLIVALVAFGLMIPYRFLDLTDLTCAGGFPLGGCLGALLLLQGFSPLTSMGLSLLAGCVLGLVTCILYLYLRINIILASILFSTMLYSINLRIMQKPTLNLFGISTLFTPFGDNIHYKIFLVGSIVCVLTFAFYMYIRSSKGLRFRAVGLNKTMAQAQSIHCSLYVIMGLVVANGFHTLAGNLMVQYQNYADVNMGSTILINGLAALMLGEIVGGTKRLFQQVAAPIIGALLYQQIQGAILTLGLPPSDFKFYTGFFVLCMLALKGNFFKRDMY